MKLKLGSRFNHPRQGPNSKNKNKKKLNGRNTQITSKETILLILNN